ncbi:MAG: hypothetical protein IJ390_14405 [Lachnospiraceae bacterium]|nr:hypothetical protein [Lachnospiraceae bacterium]
MEYQLNQENYHRFDIMEIGKMAPRSYFIPFSSKEQADTVSIKNKRYSSSKVKCLNGEWDFKFYENPGRIPQCFNTDEIDFEKIKVPSCWQFQGYGRPFYVNTRYQFPYHPPEIPRLDAVEKTFCWVGSDYGVKPRFQKPAEEYNSVGIYRKKLYLEKTDAAYILSFLGVASCLDLYVNGTFAGYSEGSHNTAEFDITPFLAAGENELLCVVHRWCTGTYLECQDMFRNNGIFRDVLLYKMNGVDFWDLDFKTRKKDGCYDAAVKAVLNTDGEVKITLSGHGIFHSKTLQSKNGIAKAVFRGLPVQEWNAEEPALYDLYFETKDSCVKKRVGFKQIEIAEDIFLLNGKKVKLHGVNHHDTSSTNGYTLTPEEIEKDVKLCKEYHIDTIRTSHYPPDPLLLELCDELGIYVVDETDLETHGTFSQQLPPNYNSITHNPKWANRCLDRVKRMFGRDKMHPSIILWSLGNEAGGYHNTDLMYRWLKSRTRIPVHYESVIHSRRKAYDVGSEMYPSLKKVHEIGEHKRNIKELNNRPYFMCEYAHAMGVGPGAMEEYWKEIYAYDNLMGGCVWEMVDHAVLHKDGSYTYGGDHGEWEHDGNFCVDGIFYPDRTPSTGAKIVRHVYRPLRIRHIEGKYYEVFNTNAFTGSDRYEIRFCFSDGRKVDVQTDVEPLTRKVIKIEGAQPLESERMTAITVDKRTGRQVSKEQIIYRDFTPVKVEFSKELPENFKVSENGVIFQKGEKVLQVSAPYTILFRAPTDNDKDFFLNTCMDDFIPEKEEIVSMDIKPDRIIVTTRISCKKQEFVCTDIYQAAKEGVLVTSRLHCMKGKGKLPRFGKAFRLDASFDLVEYEGRNGESYCDMKEQAQIEKVCCTVADMTEPNIRPQESGNRCDCRYVKVSDGKTEFGFKAVNHPFELGVKPYTDTELLTMRHRKDEIHRGTFVIISAFQMGIGTGSCGPATLSEYCYPVEEEYELQFLLS